MHEGRGSDPILHHEGLDAHAKCISEIVEKKLQRRDAAVRFVSCIRERIKKWIEIYSNARIQIDESGDIDAAVLLATIAHGQQ